MITAAASAASRQCAVPVRTTPRKLRSVSPPRLRVVGQRVQPSLDGERRAKPADDLTLRAGQRKRRRLDRISAWERGPR